MNDLELEREFEETIRLLAILTNLREAYANPNGEHSHTCACGNRWTHSNKYQAQVNDGTITDAEYAALHECRKCGAQVRQKD